MTDVPYYPEDDQIDDDEDEGFADMCCGLYVGLDGKERCMNVGTEWCDWNCPYNSVQEATIRRQRREKPAGPLLQLMDPDA